MQPPLQCGGFALEGDLRFGRIAVLFLLMLVWVPALTLLYHVIRTHTDSPATTPNPTAMIAYVAALAALAGWMFQGWLSVRNSRKQHTMNVLLQTRLNPQFADHASKIEAVFPPGNPITFEALTKPENAQVRESVRWILNYYEFIAAGLRHGDLDEPLMQDCMLTQFCRFYKKSESYIRDVRGEDALGTPDPEKARVLKALVALQPRWQRKLDQLKPPVWQR